MGLPGDQGVCPLLDLHGPFVHCTSVGHEVTENILLPNYLLVGLHKFLVTNSETQVKRFVGEEENVGDEVERSGLTIAPRS